MRLACLLITSDAALLDVVRSSFSAANVGLELRKDVTSAIELASRRHIDGFVVDCDDVPGAKGAITKIRSSRSNKQSVVLAVVNGATSVAEAVEAGANFVAGKPVQDKLLRGILDMAVPRMEREHRRYFRHKVDLPVTIWRDPGDSLAGKIMNVSEGGLAITHFGPAAIEGAANVQFVLPGTSAQVFQAKVEVVWKDAFATGLRFLRIEPNCRASFQSWLDYLEAQQRLRESTH
jgi:ActR/RegA family two-component response regulator